MKRLTSWVYCLIGILNVLDNPKSASFSLPFLSMSKFCGFRSLDKLGKIISHYFSPVQNPMCMAKKCSFQHLIHITLAEGVKQQLLGTLMSIESIDPTESRYCFKSLSRYSNMR